MRLSLNICIRWHFNSLITVACEMSLFVSVTLCLPFHPSSSLLFLCDCTVWARILCTEMLSSYYNVCVNGFSMLCAQFAITLQSSCHMVSNDMTIFQPIDLLVHTSMAAFSVDSTAFHMVRLAPLPGPRSIHLCISISGILPKFPLEMGRALCVARRVFAKGIFVLISFDLHKPCWNCWT